MDRTLLSTLIDEPVYVTTIGVPPGAATMTILCPTCGRRPLRLTTKYGLRLQCCGLWAWGECPLADAATHAARLDAHQAFDTLWRLHLVTRTEAYELLADELRLSRRDCHMKTVTKEVAAQVPAAVARIKARLAQELEGPGSQLSFYKQLADRG